jgi:hypothetical protein
MYLYCGHGYGGDFFATTRLARKKINAGIMLFGCRSASYEYHGQYEMSNTFNSFIIAGAPCVAGCLWNVLDKDIDELNKDFLKSWFDKCEKDFKALKEDKNANIDTIEQHIVK